MLLENDFGGSRLGYYSIETQKFSNSLGNFLDTNKVIDPIAIYDFLLFSSMLPPRSPLQGVRTLLPGEIQKNGITENLHRDFRVATRHESIEYFAERFDALLSEYFNEKMLDSALLLSGGIDSAIILSYLNSPVCLTWDAWGNSTDTRFSRISAAAFGVQKHLIVQSEYEKDFDVYKKAVQKLKIPLLWSASIPYARLAETAADQGVRSWFMGQNADTLFMSYPAPVLVYRLSLLNRLLPINPLFFVKNRKKYLFTSKNPLRLFAYFKSNGIFPGAWIRLPREYFEEKERILESNIRPLNHAQRVIMTEEFFTEGRKSQIHQQEIPGVWGLKVNCPYYAQSFVELALSMPQALRRLDSYDKVVFKKLAERRAVPSDVIFHKKKGLSYNIKSFLQEKRHVQLWNKMEKDEFVNYFVDIKAIRSKHENDFYTFDQLQSLYWYGQFVVYPEGLAFADKML